MSSRLEKENLVRMLKEQPLLSERPFWCMLGFHKWQRWNEPRRSPSSIYIRQSRYCDACNIYDERKQHE
jgi:hypothetical protein